jgi:hypothetical protein
LLFQYQPLLFDLCLEKQTIQVFWWPLGGTQNNPMMKKVNDACGLEWHRFAKQRIVTLCVYNVILVSFLINGIRIGGLMIIKKLFCLYVVTVFYHHQCQTQPIEEEKQIDHPLDEKFVAEMYRQRQKIFDEIEKRREARKSIQRRGSLNQPPRHFSPPFHRRALDADGEIIMDGMPTKPSPIYQDEDTFDAHHDATPLLQPDATSSQPSVSCLLQPNVSQNSQESFTTAETSAEEEEIIQQDKVET